MFSTAPVTGCIDPHVLIKQEPIGTTSDHHLFDALQDESSMVDDLARPMDDDLDDEDDTAGTLTSSIKADFAQQGVGA